MAIPVSLQNRLLTSDAARSHTVNVDLIVRGPSITACVVDGSPQLQQGLATIYPGQLSGDDPTASRACDAASCALTISADVQPSLPETLGYLEYLIDSSAATALSGYLRLHAGVVASGTSGVIIPALSGGGKSTLVSSLCMSGFHYLSDEFAIVDLDSSRVFPYAKSIGLKLPGWQLINDEYAVSTDWITARQPGGQDVFYLKAPRPLPADASVRIDYIIVPCRRATGCATLTELPRPEALMTLLHQTLNLPLHGTPGLEALMGIVEQAQCFTLGYATLPDAVEQLMQLVHPA